MKAPITLLPVFLLWLSLLAAPFGVPENLPILQGNSSLGTRYYADKRSLAVLCDPSRLSRRFEGLPSLGDTLCQYGSSAEIIVGVKNPSETCYAKVVALLDRSRSRIVDYVSAKGNPSALTISVLCEDLPLLKRQLLSSGIVSFVEPNMRMQTAALPNDPQWRLNWGLGKIKADFAWNSTTGAPSVVLAIVDTGVDWNHPDLASNIWNNTDERIDGEDNDGNGFVDDIRGWDFVDTTAPVWPGEDGTVRDNDPMDFHGHGSHCAGIAAAVGNNGIGTAGVTWGCRIMSIRAGYVGEDGDGYLELDDAAAAIVYATDNGADVISCSWGLYYNSQVIYEAVKYAYEAGVLIVAAAGNELTDYKLYPAAYNEVIAVSATDNWDNAALFSNYGDWVDLAAPGLDIYSTVYDDSYEYMSGTSMSTPFVAGAAGLVWSRFPSMNRDQVREQIRFTSDDKGDAGFDVRFGYGRINAKKVVELEQQPLDSAVSEILVDSLVVVGETVNVEVAIVNMGTLVFQGLTVQFLVNGSLKKSSSIAALASGELRQVNFSWDTSSIAEGNYNLTAYVAPIGGETRTQNNVLSRKAFARQPRTIRVPLDFATVQEAVDNASKGDTISVASGWWGNVIIYKDFLKVVGAPGAVVSGNRDGDAILVAANHVQISGFRVTGAWAPRLRDPPFSGIYVYYSEHVNVTNVVASVNDCGIFLYCSYNVTLKENRMFENKYNFGVDGVEVSNFLHNIDESNTLEEKPIRYMINQEHGSISGSSGCVILVDSTNIQLNGLQLTNNYVGVFCIDSQNITMTGVQASLNNIGLYFRNCLSLAVDQSYVNSNNAGIIVENSENVSIENTIVASYIAPDGRGILFIYSARCQARFNNLSDNRNGIWLDYSHDCQVANNEISGSAYSAVFLTNAHDNLVVENRLVNNLQVGIREGVALRVSASFNNSIYYNFLVNNTIHVVTMNSENVFDNGYPSGGNYWSNYTGVDEKSGPAQADPGSDGIGDTPHVIDEDNQDRFPLLDPYPCLHSLAAKGIRPHKTAVGQGSEVRIYVDVANLGHFTETFNVSAYANLTIIDQTTNTTLAAGNLKTLTFTWNTSSAPIGNYTISVLVHSVEGELYIDDNTLADGIITVRVPIHDVAVRTIMQTKTVIGQGFSAIGGLSFENVGDYPEAFNVTVFADGKVAAVLNDVLLASGELATRNFIWSTVGFDSGNYTISAQVEPVRNETNLADNYVADGWVIIAAVGDITGLGGLPDGKIDIRDIALIARYYGQCVPPAPTDCDLTGPILGLPDGVIDIRDVAVAAKNFGL